MFWRKSKLEMHNIITPAYFYEIFFHEFCEIFAHFREITLSGKNMFGKSDENFQRVTNFFHVEKIPRHFITQWSLTPKAIYPEKVTNFGRGKVTKKSLGDEIFPRRAFPSRLMKIPTFFPDKVYAKNLLKICSWK